MNKGYSLLKKKLVYPYELNYGDCREQQVVCPSCFEPLRLARGKQLEYLAHYPTKDEKLCVERNRSQPRSSSLEAHKRRHESLMAYLKVLQDAMLEGAGIQDRTAYEQQLKNPGLDHLIFLARHMSEPAWEELMALTLSYDEIQFRNPQFHPVMVERAMNLANGFARLIRTYQGREIIRCALAIAGTQNELNGVIRLIRETGEQLTEVLGKAKTKSLQEWREFTRVELAKLAHQIETGELDYSAFLQDIRTDYRYKYQHQRLVDVIGTRLWVLISEKLLAIQFEGMWVTLDPTEPMHWIQN